MFGWNVRGPKLRKGRGGEGPLSWGGTTFRFAGARQKHNFEEAKQEHRMNFTKTVFSDMIKNTLSLILVPQRRDGKIYQIVDEWSELEEGREPRAIQRFFFLL